MRDYLQTKLDELNALIDTDKFLAEWEQPVTNGPELSYHIAHKYYRHPIVNQLYTLSNIIISLNDSFKWSRERIADWLDTLDDQPIFYPHVPKHTHTHRRECAKGPASSRLMWSCGCFIYNNSSVMNEEPDDTAQLAPF